MPLLLFCCVLVCSIFSATCRARHSHHRYRSPSDVSAFLAWAKRKGISSSASIFRDADQLVLKSVLAIPRGRVILRVPKGLHLSGSDPSPVQEALLRQPRSVRRALQANGQAMLALRLIYERRIGAESEWAEYLALLPFDAPPRLSVLIKPSFLYLAKSPDFIKKTNDFRSSLTDVFSALQKTILVDNQTPVELRKPTISYHEFVNAWAVVASRSFGVRETRTGRDKSDVVAVMVPFADFAQHNANACTDANDIAAHANETERAFFRKHGAVKGGDNKDGDFRILSMRSYNIGENVHVCYDQFGNNERLLLHYGFTVDRNPQEYVRIVTVMQPTMAKRVSAAMLDRNELQSRRKALLRKLDLPLSCMLTEKNISPTSNCTRAIRISRVPMEHLQESLHHVCNNGRNMKQLLPLLSMAINNCSKTALSRALIRVANAVVPKKEVPASVIGQILSREQALNRGRHQVDHSHVLNVQDQMDIQNLEQSRSGQQRLLHAALRHQIVSFAYMFGIHDMKNIEINELIEVMRALNLQNKDLRPSSTQQHRISRYIDERSNMAYLGDELGRTWWDPERWVRAIDSRTGQTYYFSRVLGRAQWTMPLPNES